MRSKTEQHGAENGNSCEKCNHRHAGSVRGGGLEGDMHAGAASWRQRLLVEERGFSIGRRLKQMRSPRRQWVRDLGVEAGGEDDDDGDDAGYGDGDCEEEDNGDDDDDDDDDDDGGGDNDGGRTIALLVAMFPPCPPFAGPPFTQLLTARRCLRPPPLHP